MKDKELRSFLGLDDEKFEDYCKLDLFDLHDRISMLSRDIEEIKEQQPNKREKWEREFDKLFVGKISPAGYMAMIGDTLQEKASHADWLFKRDTSIKEFIGKLLRS